MKVVKAIVGTLIFGVIFIIPFLLFLIYFHQSFIAQERIYFAILNTQSGYLGAYCVYKFDEWFDKQLTK